MNAAELLLLVLAVASLGGVVLQYMLFLAERRRQRRHHDMLVVAKVTRVEEEIKWKVSWWHVTAVWIETQTQHVYTFRSPPFAFRPELFVGDTLVVSFDPRHANRYQMHL